MKKLILLFVLLSVVFPMFAQLTGADEIGTVVIHNRPLDDEHKIRNGTNFNDFGPTVMRGHGKFFGVRMGYEGSVNRDAELRFGLYNMNKEIVELYKPMTVHLLAGGINGFAIPCFVNAPAGDYYVVPMFRFAGETDWTVLYYSIFHPDNDIIDNRYAKLWKYTVIDEKLPLVNHIEKNGFSTHAITKAEKFTTTVTIKNMESTTLKGRIRVDYERNIKKFAVGDTYPEDDPAGDFWDVLTRYATLNGVKAAADGTFPIELTPGQHTLAFKNCVTYVFKGLFDRYNGQMNVKFLPDGKADTEENWIMLQEECSSHFINGGLKFTEVTDEFWAEVHTDPSYNRNYMGVSLYDGTTAIPEIDASQVALTYTKATGVLSLTNIPEPCSVRLISMNGTVAGVVENGSDTGVVLNLSTLPSGVYVISLQNYGGQLVKSFKIIK